MRFIVESKKYLLVIIILLCSSCSFKNVDKEEEVNDDKGIIDNIISYNSELDYNFLEYFYNEYGRDSLIKIEKSFFNPF